MIYSHSWMCWIQTDGDSVAQEFEMRNANETDVGTYRSHEHYWACFIYTHTHTNNTFSEATASFTDIGKTSTPILYI